MRFSLFVAKVFGATLALARRDGLKWPRFASVAVWLMLPDRPVGWQRAPVAVEPSA
jgi:hypothetical protein